MARQQVSADERAKRKAAHNAAAKDLREAHKGEYQEYLKGHLEKSGLPYKARLTAEERQAQEDAERLQKARAKVGALVAEFGEDVLSQPAV